MDERNRLLALDHVSEDSLDIAVALAATTSSPHRYRDNARISKTPPRIAQLSLVRDYNLATTRRPVICQIVESDDLQVLYAKRVMEQSKI